MATVNVRERRQPYDGRLAGFFERQAKRQGHFITRERLDHLTTFRLGDILTGVPGVRVQSVRGSKIVSLRGASCSPLFFIDGFPASAGPFDVDMIDPSTLEGIEIYSGLATIPSQFLGPRGLERCGVIALWSRPAPERKHMPSNGERSARTIDSLVEARAVFAAAEVDQEAAIEDRTARPAYPDSLWRAGQPGRVLVEFVVDADGAIEPGTIGVISTSHPAFAAAVVAALESTTFRPAFRRGRPVRQLVQLPFEFTPQRRTP
jgi:TonB family protein